MLRAEGEICLLMQPAVPVQLSVGLTLVPSAQSFDEFEATKSACPEDLGCENVHGMQ